jgi:hypothetical protein
MKLQNAIQTADRLARENPGRWFAVWHDLDYQEFRVSDGREVCNLVDGCIIRDQDVKYETI